MSKRKNNIGIDVSKQLLEVAVHESDFRYRCPNQAGTFAELLAELIALRPARIVLEATGVWKNQSWLLCTRPAYQ